jgi:hypothetical protein
LQANGCLNLHQQPAEGLPADFAGDQRRSHHGEGALDGLPVAQAHAGLREQFPPLLLPPSLGIELSGMAVTDVFALHGRRFALSAVFAKLLAAAVVGVCGFEWVVSLFVCPTHPLVRVS